MPLCTIYPLSAFFFSFLFAFLLHLAYTLSCDVRDYDDHERRWTGLDWTGSDQHFSLPFFSCISIQIHFIAWIHVSLFI